MQLGWAAVAGWAGLGWEHGEGGRVAISPLNHMSIPQLRIVRFVFGYIRRRLSVESMKNY
jgi:hypothetical protein